MGLFNRIKLETPESVELEFNLAGIGNRAYALCLDYFILGFVLVIILIIWAFVYLFIDTLNPRVGQVLGLWLFAIQLIITFVIYVGYFVFFETLWQGQTPGKKWVNIRVISDDGTVVSLTQVVLRALLRPIDDIFFMGAFLIIFTPKEKRLGDLLAGTVVIRQQEKKVNTELNVIPQAQKLARQIQEEAEITNLLPDDFALVREYLQRRYMMTPEARNQVSVKISDRLKERINLETIRDNNPELFLEAIYLAYQKIYRT
ncbi:MAG: RDD family protein [Gloeocapsa sp. DLM2.Bin57]|nr:MAG: RDD family protein [Gloeocapsa sp. DLM2.Bin57]